MLKRTLDHLGRRDFLKRAGILGASIPVLGAGLAVACGGGDSTSSPKAVARSGRSATEPAAAATEAKAAAQPTAHTSPATAHQGLTADQIDAMHKKGVEDFLKNQATPLTKGKGNVPLAPRLDGNVKVFNLTMDEVAWETTPGVTDKARGYNGMIPGPIIRATEGDRVRILVKNNLTESSSIHWHGLYVPNNMDGVPYVNQEPIRPGATFTYEFTLRNSGTHMYHSHHNALDQVNRGLLGAFIVDPLDATKYPKFDKEFIIVLNDTRLGFTLNGKGFPATDALVVKKGERIVVRWLNEGLMHHPMHLHGMAMQVFAQDGWPVPQPYLCDTLDVAPGARFDTLIEATEAGVWAFHCHILSHAESPEGMFGMVTAMVVQA